MDLETLFQSYADDFLSGDHLAFGKSFAHPLIVYSPFGIRIEKTLQDTLYALSDRLASARMAGATRVQSRARAEALGTSHRQPVHVSWTFFNDRNQPCGTSLTRYYIRSGPGQAPVIELIEILESTIHTAAPRLFADARH